MMKQKGADKTEPYWDNLWGNPKDDKKSGRLLVLHVFFQEKNWINSSKYHSIFVSKFQDRRKEIMMEISL